MRESIYTIPVNDIFGKPDGCPICRMNRMLEERCLDFISGAAMMEPDVRIATNREGFCGEHLTKLSQGKNRLALALMLETHLDELLERQLPYQEKSAMAAESCFVCREIRETGERLMETAIRLWQTDAEFRERLRGQEYYCMKHYRRFCALAERTLGRKRAAGLIQDITLPTQAYLGGLRADVHDFTLLFDYRNANRPAEREEIKTAIERAKAFLE